MFDILDEFKEAIKLANETKQLHVLVEDPEIKTKVSFSLSSLVNDTYIIAG